MTATLLMVDQLRARIPTAVGDDALQLILDSCEDVITEWAGALTAADYDEPDPVTEVVYAFGRTVVELRRPAQSVLTVSDITGTTVTELVDVDDWRLEGDRLFRVPAERGWGYRTIVEYVPEDNRSRRRTTLIKLAELELNYQGGLGGEGAAGWNESYSSYERARQEILNTLYMPPAFA